MVFSGSSLLLRIPVAFGIGLGGAVVFTVYGYSMNSFSQTGFYGLDNFSLLAIPFFLFAGAIMEYSGISRSIFAFVDAFVGRFRASTGTVAIFACAAFGALTGSTQATIASISKIVYPEMDKRGYEPAYQAALMASAGFLGDFHLLQLRAAVKEASFHEVHSAAASLSAAGSAPSLSPVSVFSVVSAVSSASGSAYSSSIRASCAAINSSAFSGAPR